MDRVDPPVDVPMVDTAKSAAAHSPTMVSVPNLCGQNRGPRSWRFEINDASDFSTQVEVAAARVGQHRVLRATGPSVLHVLAAFCLEVSAQDDTPSHTYFE